MNGSAENVSSAGRDQASSAIWVAVSQVELPEKKYFKIGEVAHLVGVEPHVLRYWQTQFTQVRPHKSRSGHRLYRRKDVETLLAIKELLHVQRFTIAGARQALRNAVVHRGDITRPPMEAEPAVEAKPQQAELELVALSGDQLQGAMERELAVQTGAEVEVEVGELANTEPPVDASTAVDEVPVSSAPAAEVVAAPVADAASVADVGPEKPGAPTSGVSTSENGQDVAGRLNFPLLGADRQALQHARREVLGLLAVLERETASDRRQTLFPGAAPPLTP
jgi:DNA-binding transcriptional MerR regulator